MEYDAMHKNELDVKFMSPTIPGVVTPASTSKTRVPTQPRAQQTRQALLDAAEREFGRHGYAATTAKTVAALARTATGSFYQYFESKDHALREIARARQTATIEHALHALDAVPALEGDADAVLDGIRARMRTIVGVTMDYQSDHRGLHAVLAERRLVDPELDALLRAGESRLVDRVIELLRAWGHVEDVEATAFLLFAALRGAVQAHVAGHARVSDGRFVAAAIEALVRIALPISLLRSSAPTAPTLSTP
jgi:AcrR family transcriptional regulator